MSEPAPVVEPETVVVPENDQEENTPEEVEKRLSALKLLLQLEKLRERAKELDQFEPPLNHVFRVDNKISCAIVNFNKRHEDEPEELKKQVDQLDAQKMRGIPFSHVPVDITAVPDDDWQPVKGVLKYEDEVLLLHKETAKALSNYSLEIYHRPHQQRPEFTEVVSIYALPSHVSAVNYRNKKTSTTVCVECAKSNASWTCPCGTTFCDDFCFAYAKRHTLKTCEENFAKRIALEVAMRRQNMNEINRRCMEVMETKEKSSEETQAMDSSSSSADAREETQ